MVYMYSMYSFAPGVSLVDSFSKDFALDIVILPFSLESCKSFCDKGGIVGHLCPIVRFIVYLKKFDYFMLYLLLFKFYDNSG